MTLYRAKPADGVAWITGGSTGIGRQVALALAAEGYTVIATARAQAELDEVSATAIASGHRVIGMLGDVTDEAAMGAIVERIEREHGPIALAIFNAGTYLPSHGERLEVHNFEKTFDVNLMGVVNGLVPVADRMRDRGFGQIAIVGSVTSYYGLPSAAAYGASKAALNSMAQSLKFDFDKLNIRIQVVNPGFVETPLTAKNKFKMPALMKVEQAAERMVDGFRKGGFEITFPRRLSWVLKAGGLLPQPAYHWLIGKATGWDKRHFGKIRKP
jgi:NAD(P)-dependent dehydrogenase (short-subunit alcohol dehydrogenase family)